MHPRSTTISITMFFLPSEAEQPVFTKPGVAQVSIDTLVTALMSLGVSETHLAKMLSNDSKSVEVEFGDVMNNRKEDLEWQAWGDMDERFKSEEALFALEN